MESFVPDIFTCFARVHSSPSIRYSRRVRRTAFLKIFSLTSLDIIGKHRNRMKEGQVIILALEYGEHLPIQCHVMKEDDGGERRSFSPNLICKSCKRYPSPARRFLLWTDSKSRSGNQDVGLCLSFSLSLYLRTNQSEVLIHHQSRIIFKYSSSKPKISETPVGPEQKS